MLVINKVCHTIQRLKGHMRKFISNGLNIFQHCSCQITIFRSNFTERFGVKLFTFQTKVIWWTLELEVTYFSYLNQIQCYYSENSHWASVYRILLFAHCDSLTDMCIWAPYTCWLYVYSYPILLILSQKDEGKGLTYCFLQQSNVSLNSCPASCALTFWRFICGCWASILLGWKVSLPLP